MEAEVASACRPRGQVRVHGELWEAICAEGADAGEIVRVTSVDGLKLVVERAESRLGDGDCALSWTSIVTSTPRESLP